jgi:ABC-type Fe3+-hydroxamate transport system substrate-binding protein
VPPTKSTIHHRSWRLIWLDYTGTRECLPKKRSRINALTSYSEETNQMLYLIDVSIPNSSNRQTAYTEKIIKYAELNIKWKTVANRRGIYLTCHYICNRSHSSQTSWCPQATILIGFAIRDHKKICNHQYMQNIQNVLMWQQHISAVSNTHIYFLSYSFLNAWGGMTAALSAS